jgi:predicted Zn-dependent peptidase
MRIRTMLTPLIPAALIAASTASAQSVQAEEFTLDNGMQFLLVPRKDQPNNIAAGWMARVGSVNERPGITGISHFFEHMMFKGTRTIGTRDAEADAKFMKEIEAARTELRNLTLTEQYDRYRRGEIDDPWDPANDTPKMGELREKVRSLMEQQRDVIVKDEFDKVYTDMGASAMNAFTSYDLTFYFITVPSNKFELWAWMESDRLTDSVFREFYSERDVVHEERRLRTESTPTGIFDEQFESMFWLSSPYNWPVIGWPSDLNSYTYDQAKEYYATYYAPNNLTGVIVGDFDPGEVKPLIEKYFGRLKRGPEAPPVVTLEVPSKAEMRMYAECDCQPQVRVWYKTPPFAAEDSFTLQVLAEVLNGRTGRLYRKMVEEEGIASSASAGLDARKYAGAFAFEAETKGDATPEQLLASWEEVVADLRENPVSEHELQKVRNQVVADQFRQLQNNFFLMVQLGYYEALDDWRYINEAPSKLQQVTAEDIQDAIEKYFTKENRAIAFYTRKAGASAEDPALMALDPQVRAMVKQQLAQLEQVDDVAMLDQIYASMQGQAAQVPEQFKPAFDYMLQWVEGRIAELKQGD